MQRDVRHGLLAPQHRTWRLRRRQERCKSASASSTGREGTSRVGFETASPPTDRSTRSLPIAQPRSPSPRTGKACATPLSGLFSVRYRKRTSVRLTNPRPPDQPVRRFPGLASALGPNAAGNEQGGPGESLETVELKRQEHPPMIPECRSTCSLLAGLPALVPAHFSLDKTACCMRPPNSVIVRPLSHGLDQRFPGRLS